MGKQEEAPLREESDLPDVLARWAILGPAVGLICGSGLAGLAGGVEVEDRAAAAAIGLPAAGVPGHAGEWILGRIGGVRCVIALGRLHLYEGYSPAEVAAPVRLLARLGIHTLVLSNAAGCLRTDWAPGDWMLVRDQINLTGLSPLTGGPRFVDMTEIYSRILSNEVMRAARASGFRLREGIYAGVPGPQYETPAEVRMLRGLGADAVGMSTVLEAIAARALGLRVAGFSCLTNLGAGLSSEPLRHEEVTRRSGEASGRLAAVLRVVLPGWADRGEAAGRGGGG